MKMIWLGFRRVRRVWFASLVARSGKRGRGKTSPVLLVSDKRNLKPCGTIQVARYKFELESEFEFEFDSDLFVLSPRQVKHILCLLTKHTNRPQATFGLVSARMRIILPRGSVLLLVSLRRHQQQRYRRSWPTGRSRLEADGRLK